VIPSYYARMKFARYSWEPIDEYSGGYLLASRPTGTVRTFADCSCLSRVCQRPFLMATIPHEPHQHQTDPTV